MPVSQNLHSVLLQIRTAALKYDRDPASVRLVAVSKTHPVELIQEAWEAGQIDFGENRTPEMAMKQAALPTARWHMIGHLQRRQVKDIIPFVHLIHSVDSDRLLEKINREAQACNRVVDCLLQLNISEEIAKSGIDEAGAAALLARIDEWPQVRILGLMGMAQIRGSEDDTPVIRGQFARLRKAFEAFSAIDHPRILMQELSMGMSDDLEEAISEGATLVRIGTAVFGQR